MKRGTRTWILYYMVIVHILAVLGTTGVVMYSSLCYPGVLNWIFLLFVSWLNYVIFDSMFSYINRILKRRKRML